MLFTLCSYIPDCGVYFWHIWLWFCSSLLYTTRMFVRLTFRLITGVLRRSFSCREYHHAFCWSPIVHFVWPSDHLLSEKQKIFPILLYSSLSATGVAPLGTQPNLTRCLAIYMRPTTTPVCRCILVCNFYPFHVVVFELFC